ncbi:hypothetical protein HWI79_705 [Cryptosporidium felis]|nr:hypothetical protein HWI79_705 [Cryptosporidium felis]
MDDHLICNRIYNLKVDVEPSTRTGFPKIERILADGIPSFAEEIGNFSSNAEKYFISTSSRANDIKTNKEKRYFNNGKWDAIDNQYSNTLKNLDTLTNVIFCIQKNFGDKIQYLNISQSYRMICKAEHFSKKSYYINEASKKELLLSIFRRFCVLKPFIKKVNDEMNKIPLRISTHIDILNTINELLPIWKISLSNRANKEQLSHDNRSCLSFKFCLHLPQRNTFINNEQYISNSWLHSNDNNIFGDLFVTVLFNNKHEDITNNCGYRKTSTRVFIKLPNLTSHILNKRYQLNIQFSSNNSNCCTRVIDTTPKVIFPSCLNSELSKQIHSTLHNIYWSLLDRSIYHAFVRQLIDIQRESSETVSIKELHSEEVSFSINKTNFHGDDRAHFTNMGIDLENICISYKPVNYEKRCLNICEMRALRLLREAFLEIWNCSLKNNIDNYFEIFMHRIETHKFYNGLLERWISKLLQKNT